MKNIKNLYNKYKDIIPYLFFGVCTTIINIISYWIMAYPLKLGIMISTVVAWFAAILFAYITNKKWVFHSNSNSKKDIFREFGSFLLCRLITGAIDLLIMYIFVDIIGFNDIIIKILANVIVIIINYIASKLIIFNNSNNNLLLKLKIKYKKHDFLINLCIVSLFFIATFIFLLNSPLHMWNGSNSHTDSSVFKTVAMMMNKGFSPYLQTFDHKGPLLYIFNYIGLLISYYKGVWVIEFINLFVTFCALYKIARLKCNRTFSLISVFLAISLLFKFFDGGNLVEEYALSFISVSLYIFLDYLLNKKIDKFRLIICGFSLGSVLLLRPNMISTWIVFCIIIFINCIKDKKYLELKKFILYFIIGVAIVVLPTLIYLIINNSLVSFWESYIIFNKIYCASSSISISITQKWESFIYFLDNQLFIFSLIITLCLLKFEKKEIHFYYFIYIIISLVLVSISGRTFNHYGMVLIPITVFPIASFFGIIKDIKNKKVYNVLSIVLIVYSIYGIIFPNWISTVQTLPKRYFERNENKITTDVLNISDIIKNKTNENDKISVYGNWDIIYVISNRIHATKYSYQFPIGIVSPTIMDDYFEQLKEEMPKIIVVESGYYNETMKNFLDTNNYILIWQQYEILDDSALIFELEG